MTTQIPVSAITFEEPLFFEFSSTKSGEEEKKKASMLGYSGGIIKDHWLFGDLAIDVSGINFKSNKIPILEQHDVDRKIGIAKKPDLSDNKVFFNEIDLLDNVVANEFYDNAKQGFPYQASISIRPTKIEEISDGTESEVNGYKMKGPAVIFRESNFRESSVVVFGADPKTNSTPLNEQYVNVELSDNLRKKLEDDMTDNTEKLAEYETKLAEYKTQLEELQQYKEKSDALEGTLANMSKSLLQKDLATSLSEGDIEFVMQFYDKLDEAELKLIADKICELNKAINEIGKPAGDSETNGPGKDVTFEEAKAYAAEHQVSLTDAFVTLAKKNQ